MFGGESEGLVGRRDAPLPSARRRIAAGVFRSPSRAPAEASPASCSHARGGTHAHPHRRGAQTRPGRIVRRPLCRRREPHAPRASRTPAHRRHLRRERPGRRSRRVGGSVREGTGGRRLRAQRRERRPWIARRSRYRQRARLGPRVEGGGDAARRDAAGASGGIDQGGFVHDRVVRSQAGSAGVGRPGSWSSLDIRLVGARPVRRPPLEPGAV